MNALRQALVVDDNELNSRLVAVFLKRLGWQAQLVSSGDAALRCLAKQSFELGMDGAEVCRRIRQELQLARLPVVAYTAHSTPEEKERILAGGFNGLLVKPLSFIDLRDVC